MATYLNRAAARESRDATVQVMARRTACHDLFDKPAFLSGTLLNQSPEGLYLEIDQALQPGSTIIVKMAGPDGDLWGPYTLHRGRVAWCRPLAGRTLPLYGVGVKVYERVVQTALNPSHPDLS